MGSLHKSVCSRGVGEEGEQVEGRGAGESKSCRRAAGHTRVRGGAGSEETTPPPNRCGIGLFFQEGGFVQQRQQQPSEHMQGHSRYRVGGLR